MAPAHQRQSVHQNRIEGLAVDRQRHGFAKLRIVERRIDAVDHQV